MSNLSNVKLQLVQLFTNLCTEIKKVAISRHQLKMFRLIFPASTCTYLLVPLFPLLPLLPLLSTRDLFLITPLLNQPTSVKPPLSLICSTMSLIEDSISSKYRLFVEMFL